MEIDYQGQDPRDYEITHDEVREAIRNPTDFKHLPDVHRAQLMLYRWFSSDRILLLSLTLNEAFSEPRSIQSVRVEAMNLLRAKLPTTRLNREMSVTELTRAFLDEFADGVEHRDRMTRVRFSRRYQEWIEQRTFSSHLELRSVQSLLSPREQALSKRKQAETASDKIDASCEELLGLVNDKTSTEEDVHQWLFRTEHWLFLDPEWEQVWSKEKFGNKISDFVVKRSGGQRYLFIELESPQRKLVKRSTKDQEMRAEFHHAVHQTDDWLIRLRKQLFHYQARFPGIYDPEPMVVMGRSSELTNEDLRAVWQHLKTKQACFTYDELVGRAKRLASNLRRIC